MCLCRVESHRSCRTTGIRRTFTEKSVAPPQMTGLEVQIEPQVQHKKETEVAL